MSGLTYSDKIFLNSFFKMELGYVLNFTNRTFESFFYETMGVNIYDQKYHIYGSSKAKRLNAFLSLESDYLIVKLLKNLLEYHKKMYNLPDSEYTIYMQIIDRLSMSKQMISSEINIANEESIKECISEINHCIENDNPKLALDRIHTLISGILSKLSQQDNKDTSLPSAYGQYIKTLNIDDTTYKILKSQIHFLDIVNQIRNNESLAHPNPLFKNHDAAFYIINNIQALLIFLVNEKKRSANLTNFY